MRPIANQTTNNKPSFNSSAQPTTNPHRSPPTQHPRTPPIPKSVPIGQDEYEKFKHSAQLERNTHSTAMAVLEEQNRHLCDKVHVLKDTHAQFTGALDHDDQHVQRLLAERRTLEQRLEEAHLHLSDIKSTWSAQNLALETQVSRLSHQVAAETTEKRKALHSQDDHVERLKLVQFELECSRTAVEERDNKVKRRRLLVVGFAWGAIAVINRADPHRRSGCWSRRSTICRAR